MSRHLDIHREAKPATLPRVLKWPLFVAAFPIVLLTAVVWLPRLLLKKREPPVNTTPCGALCKHAFWYEPKGGELHNRRGWKCGAYQGIDVDSARTHFTTRQDPKNCMMFVRKRPDE